MKDVATLLASLRRPRLLIRAARFGLDEYDRSRDLKRLISAVSPPSPAKAVSRLMDEEARLEETRQTGDASYSVSRHVEILIAIMGEARLLPQKEVAA
ncbi:MAG: hypothetical protein ACJA06_002042 [Halocynthiibacter sp.]|jgi:hypothetical protein